MELEIPSLGTAAGLRMLRQGNFELEASLGYLLKEYQVSLDFKTPSQKAKELFHLCLALGSSTKRYTVLFPVDTR